MTLFIYGLMWMHNERQDVIQSLFVET